MYIKIEQRNYKEECTMCGCDLWPKERFIIATNGEKEIRMCLLCARKTSFTIPRGSNKRISMELASNIKELLEEIKELNQSDNK